MVGITPELLIGFAQILYGKSILRKQDRIGQAFTRLATIVRERMAYLTSAPDPGPLLHTLLSFSVKYIVAQCLPNNAVGVPGIRN